MPILFFKAVVRCPEKGEIIATAEHLLFMGGIMLRRMLLASMLFSAIVFQGFAYGPADSCVKFTTKMSDGTTMYFRLYVPRHYSTQYKYPLVLQMHGIGECGTNDSVQVNHEYMSHQWMLDSVKNKYQPFVLYPQCPSSSYEFGYFNTGTTAQKGTAALPAVAAVKILDSLIKVYSIDTARLYVGGLSWGGLGTQGIMTSYPNKFAAAFPCAGENWLNKDSVPKYRITTMTSAPFWLWHGLSDGTVPCKPDTLLVSAIIKSGIPVVKFVSGWTLSTLKFTPQGISVDSLNRSIAGGANYLATWIPSGDHGSGWQTCFYSPSFVPWLMSKSRVNGQSIFTWPAPGPLTASTAVNESPKQLVVAGGAMLTTERGIIRWQGVSRLPANVNIFSVTGSLLKHYTIGSASGVLAYSGLPTGVYMITLGSRQSSVNEAKTIMVISK